MEIWNKMWVGVFFWTQCTCCYYFRALARESYDSCNHSSSVTRHSLRHSVDVIQRLTKCFLTLNRTTNRRAAHITWPTRTDDRMTDGLSQTFDSKHAQQFYVRTRATSVLQLISSTGFLLREHENTLLTCTRISWISSILFYAYTYGDGTRISTIVVVYSFTGIYF